MSFFGGIITVMTAFLSIIDTTFYNDKSFQRIIWEEENRKEADRMERSYEDEDEVGFGETHNPDERLREMNDFEDFQESFVSKFSYLGFLKLYQKKEDLMKENNKQIKNKERNRTALDAMKRDMEKLRQYFKQKGQQH